MSDHPTDRLINEAVATAVMLWEKRKVLPIFSVDSSGDIVRTWWPGADGSVLRPSGSVFNPAGDIKDAYNVIGKIHARRLGSVHIESQYVIDDTLWTVRFGISKPQAGWSLPRTICLAALEAVFKEGWETVRD